jgi:hypothetical protein
MADKWEVTDRNRYDLSLLARWIALCDLSRALAIVKKFPESEQGRYTADIANALDYIAQAESLLKSCDQGFNSWHSNRARVQLACRIALKQPVDAVRIVDNLASTGRDEEEKAKAYGMIAKFHSIPIPYWDTVILPNLEIPAGVSRRRWPPP